MQAALLSACLERRLGFLSSLSCTEVLVLQFPTKESSKRHTQQERSKVLVVDDHENILRVLADLFAQTGYEVFSAESAETALELLDSNIPDIIICDIMMPGMDGFSFHHMVRESEDWSNIPFVFLTALSENKQIMKGKESGCDDYLMKPFDPEHLLSVVQGKVTASKRREGHSRQKIEQYTRRVINTLSHEFRTPLVAINTGSELLIDQYDNLTEDRVKHLLNSIYRGGQRLQRLVDDFMALQAIDTGAASITCKKLRRKVKLAEVLETSVETFISMSYEGNAPEVAVSIPEELESNNVLVYDVQIRDVVIRLLSNAHKFGHSSEGIQVFLSSDGQSLAVHIRDHGPGMPEHISKLACQTFTQIDRETFEQQGCGLGLAIANYYAELNGCQLGFCCPEEGGLEVILQLPECE